MSALADIKGLTEWNCRNWLKDQNGQQWTTKLQLWMSNISAWTEAEIGFATTEMPNTRLYHIKWRT